MTVEFNPIDSEHVVSHTRGLLQGLMRDTQRESLMSSKVMWTVKVLDGFEDVLGEPLGADSYDNTVGAMMQLVDVLALSSNPAIAQTLEEMKDESPTEVIKHLREQAVLDGTKIIDLGSGQMAAFALAAKSLGAESWTVDAEPLSQKAADQLDGHIVVDLRDPNAANKIIGASGGNFDVVTESIIGAFPSQHGLYKPSGEIISGLAEQLLKPGGHFVQPLG